MNYEKIYNQIVEYRRVNKISGMYHEKHHILPRSLGGGDDKSNIVNVSAKEHFILHLLLTKIYKSGYKHFKMIKAFMAMVYYQSCNHERYISSRAYDKLRKEFSSIQSMSQSGERNSQYGSIWVYDLITKKAFRIKKTDALPNNCKYGRIDEKQPSNYMNMLQDRRNEKVENYTKWYKIYDLYGFEKFCEITSYSFSKQNLVSQFKKYVTDFIPQNGKPRGRK